MTTPSKEILRSLELVAQCYVNSREQVPAAIAAPVFNLPNLLDYLQRPEGKPYGRQLIHQDAAMEVILMNWDLESACLPHDHGTSEGWVRVLKGAASHTCYSVEGEMPEAAQEEIFDEGTVFYARNGIVHHMANKSREPLITLHFYFPPIHKMEVFDIDAARSAIVSEDCGAWWPDSQEQIISSRSLSVASPDIV